MEAQDLRDMKAKLDGVCNAVEVGFYSLRQDMRYVARFNILAAAISVLALFLSVLALVIVVENRSLLYTFNRDTVQPQHLESAQLAPTVPAK